MALIFIDGFDHYTANADFQKKWGAGTNNQVAISAAAARNGAGGVRATTNSTGGLSGIGVNIGTRGTVILGFALRIVALPTTANTINTTVVAFCELGTGTPGIKIVLRSTGQLKICAQSGTKTDNWTGTALTTGQWYYVEVKCKYVTSNCALGDVEIRIDYGDGNGPVVVNKIAAGQATTYNGSAGGFQYIDIADPNGGSGWPASTVVYDIDDLYILDTTGTTNNTYLGDSKVETLFPDGAGASAQFTPNAAGANYTKVNEASVNSDTTYVSTSGVNNRDSYSLADMASTPQTVFGVQQTSWVRTDASETTRKMANSLNIGGTYYDGGNSGNIGGAYSAVRTLWESNPATVASWVRSDIDGLEAGVKLVS